MAKKVRIIEATNIAPARLKRVAAYARVSMETERLNHSLSAQVSYYSELIQKHPGWVYAGVFADDGITGTKTNRPEFQRMLQECEAGNIDIILTKSISRFARNTVDLLETVRHLKELGIEVQFEKEHISSLSDDGELMLSLLASFAQEEIRSLSDNVKWGTRKRMQQGIPNGHFRVYGYRWEGDVLVPIPEEAAIVRRIFQNFLDGKSRLETEREFAAEGITTREGCRWVDSNIKVVLTNVTYTGNLLLQKEYITDPITKKRKKNRGELPQYYVPDTHEAIIDRETFDYVQSEISRRKELGPLANKALNTCCFTGKIKCGICGQSYMHSTRTNRATRTLQPDKVESWSCGTRKKKGGRCPGKAIPHRILLSETADALGLEEFDDQVFAEQIDHIIVTGEKELTFHFTDGHTLVRQWINTAKTDCWTPERRAEVSEYRRNHAPNRHGVTCFTTKIKCAVCGNNFNRQIQRSPTAADGKNYYWRCPHPTECGVRGIRDDKLREVSAEVLGLPAFDEAAFLEQVERIEVDAGTVVTFILKDGSRVERKWDTSRPPTKWSEERRARFEAQPKQTYSPERRQQMSEHMKQLRKERGVNWRKEKS